MVEQDKASGLRLREINRLKHRITFGNTPAFFHAVSTSLGLAEGLFRYGFENSLDTLLDKRNWNLRLLGGHTDAMGEYHCEQGPRLSVYKLFNKEGFEIHCIPWLGQDEIDSEYLNHPKMEFKHWNPLTMKVIFRIANLHTFIHMYFEHGDQADLELIKYAHNISEAFIDDLQSKLNVVKVHGVSVKGFFDYVEKKLAAEEEIYLPRVYNFKQRP